MTDESVPASTGALVSVLAVLSLACGCTPQPIQAKSRLEPAPPPSVVISLNNNGEGTLGWAYVELSYRSCGKLEQTTGPFLDFPVGPRVRSRFLLVCALKPMATVQSTVFPWPHPHPKHAAMKTRVLRSGPGEPPAELTRQAAADLHTLMQQVLKERRGQLPVELNGLRLTMTVSKAVYLAGGQISVTVTAANTGEGRLIFMPAVVHLAVEGKGAEKHSFPGSPVPPWKDARSIGPGQRTTVRFKHLGDGQNYAWSLKPGRYSIWASYCVPDEWSSIKESWPGEFKKLRGRIWTGKVRTNTVRIQVRSRPQ